jgi:cytochrome c5
MRKLMLLVLISSIDPAAAAEAIDQPPPPTILPPAAERDLVTRVCSACHAPEMITAKRHTSDEWDDIVAKMVDHGARANDVEQEEILAYLVRFYGKPASQQ